MPFFTSLKVLIFILVFQVIVKAEECIFQDNCERCLSSNLNCAWCTDKNYKVRARCMEKSLLIAYGCQANHTFENEPTYTTLQNKELMDYNSKDQRANQIQPQRSYLKLVKSHSQRLKLSYRPARNNLLELYVLMDLTWTMRDDKETLVKLGTELTAALRNLTTNYRLGFGSFADKPVFPIITPELKDNPCAVEQFVCEPTYGYKHHLSLTENVTAFIGSVNASRITGNLDNLEGGMDALMQVLVCPDKIGWRQEARKIVLLVTDGLMHYAGDGLLAGIIKRNDKQCHLSESGDYLGSLEFDYPSLEEIYRELTKRKVNVIFAVTAEVIKNYRQLSNLMQEVTNTELLRADSSNILELISKSYQSITKRVQFEDNSPPHINVEYETDCGGQYKTLRKRNFCNNIEPGQQVDFYLTITLKEYPPDNVYSFKMKVEEISLNENLELEVELQKPCPCDEKSNPKEENGRDECNDNGFLQCGMCQCDEGWTGLFCTCPTVDTNLTTTELVENMCRTIVKPADELGPVCSNRGECDCGTCVCFTGFNGKYCECQDCDSDCDPERAECVCGNCVCKLGWSGSQCNCPESTEKCTGPTGELCSQRGHCECGTCTCDEPYMGKYCEIGSGLDNKLCSYFEHCVTCLIEEKLGTNECVNFTEECSHRFTYAYVEEELESEVICLVRLTNQYDIKCDHFFKYETTDQKDNHIVINVNNCEPINYVSLMSFISLGTFLFGLLVTLAVWRCIRHRDALEYAKFEEQQKSSESIENPIYRDPITRYKVPDQLKKSNSNPFL